MSHGFLVCNYNSLLPLFRLLDCLDFVPKTPFCLVSVPFRHLPIIVQRLPCFLAGQCVLGSSHPSQSESSFCAENLFLSVVKEFLWMPGVCVNSGPLSPNPFVGNIHKPLFLCLSLPVSLLPSLAYFSFFFTSSLPPCLQESPIYSF